MNEFVSSFFAELEEKFKCCTVDAYIPEENKVAYTILADKVEVCDGILELNSEKGSVMSTVFGLYGVVHEKYVADLKDSEVALAEDIFQSVSKEWKQNLEDVDLVCTLLDGDSKPKTKEVLWIDVANLKSGEVEAYILALRNHLTKMRQESFVKCTI